MTAGRMPLGGSTNGAPPFTSQSAATRTPGMGKGIDNEAPRASGTEHEAHAEQSSPRELLASNVDATSGAWEWPVRASSHRSEIAACESRYAKLLIP